MQGKPLLKLLLLLLLLGFSTPVLAEPRDFYLVTELKNWTEAQRRCRETLYDLVTLESVADWARARQLMGRSGHALAWVGLYDDINSWRWALDNTAQGGSIESVSSLTFSLDNSGGEERCSYVSSSHQGDGNCQWIQRFVCFDEATNSYIPFQTLLKWEASRSYCQEHYTDLATMRSQQERNAIMAAIGSNSVWWSIGLYRDGWKWSDQSQSSEMVWAPGQPTGGSEYCGAVSADGLHDSSCQLELPFICSGPRRRVVKVALKTNSAVDLNDPLVQDSLLKQMEERVGASGFQQQLKIQWREQPHRDIFNRMGP